MNREMLLALLGIGVFLWWDNRNNAAVVQGATDTNADFTPPGGWSAQPYQVTPSNAGALNLISNGTTNPNTTSADNPGQAIATKPMDANPLYASPYTGVQVSAPAPDTNAASAPATSAAAAGLFTRLPSGELVFSNDPRAQSGVAVEPSGPPANDQPVGGGGNPQVVYGEPAHASPDLGAAPDKRFSAQRLAPRYVGAPIQAARAASVKA